MPQDFMLIHALKMKDKEILKLWKEKLNYIKKNNGMAVFNIHPDDYIFGGKLELYKELLKYLSKESAWFALPNEIAKHWKER